MQPANVEHSYNSVSSTTSELISAVAKVDGVCSSTEIFDVGTWFEHVISIENFHFVCSTTTCNNQISGVLLELSTVDQAWLIRRETFIPGDILNGLAGSEVPQLQLLVGLVGTGQ